VDDPRTIARIYGLTMSRKAQARRAARIATFADARRLARRRVPPVIFDYVDGAAEAEVTMRANRAAFETIRFRPKMGRNTGTPKLATTVLGQPVEIPVLLSPVGGTRLVNNEGDLAGARAAAKAGTIFALSSMTAHTIEAVAAAADGPKWFQLYMIGGRAGAEQLVSRAHAAGYQALVVTMDSQISGFRERDIRHGLKFPISLDARTLATLAVQLGPHPDWLLEYRKNDVGFDIANVVETPDGPIRSLGQAIGSMTEHTPTWDDVKWIRSLWKGPLLAKGIVSADDARQAVASGVDGVIVSNHGGRQLDGLPSSLDALVTVLDAVGNDVEVLVDGGIRRGSDAVHAIALGARAVMIGRPWVFALAQGQPGVDRMLEVFRTDIDRTLRLLGCASVTELDRSYLTLPD